MYLVVVYAIIDSRLHVLPSYVCRARTRAHARTHTHAYAHTMSSVHCAQVFWSYFCYFDFSTRQRERERAEEHREADEH